MWSRLPKDVRLQILHEVAKDPAGARAVNCLDKEARTFMLTEEMPETCSIKPKLCHSIRRTKHAYHQQRFFKILPSPTLWAMDTLLAFTARHFHSLKDDQTELAKILPAITEQKRALLRELGSAEIFMLYLVQQGMRHHGTNLEECIFILENIIAGNVSQDEEQHIADVLNKLVQCASEADQSVYMRASNLLTARL